MTNLYDDLRPDPTGLPIPSSALTVGAHPDDAEFGAGGTLARWVDAGCRVTMLILTDGSKGTWNPDIAPDELVADRHREQQAAANILGASEVIHLDLPDGRLRDIDDLDETVCEWIRRVRPDVVLGHDPWRRYMLHPDHRAAGWALIDGIVAARDHLFYPHQGLEKHRPSAVLLWQADEVDHFEDIGPTFERKVEALLQHASQSATTMGDAASSAEARAEFVKRLRAMATDQGQRAGLDLAEGFKLIRP